MSLVKGVKPPMIERTPAPRGRLAAAMHQKIEQQTVQKKRLCPIVSHRATVRSRECESSSCSAKAKLHKVKQSDFMSVDISPLCGWEQTFQAMHSKCSTTAGRKCPISFGHDLILIFFPETGEKNVQNLILEATEWACTRSFVHSRV